MEKWTKVGLIILVFGLALVAFTVPKLRTEVVDHEMMTTDGNLMSMGPYETEGFSWSIWIEDYYEGFDGGQHRFDSYASVLPEGGDDHVMATAQEYRTREIEGVECEFMHTFEYLGPDDIYFIVEWWEEPLDGQDTIHVFLLRTAGTSVKILFSIGVVLVALGGIALGLVMWSTKRKGDGPTDQG